VTELETMIREHKAKFIRSETLRQKQEMIQNTIDEILTFDEKEKDDEGQIELFFKNY
jgi:hypothetical protein